MNSTNMAPADDPRCGVPTLDAGYRCARPAGHAGYHETTGGYQWRRSFEAIAADEAATPARSVRDCNAGHVIFNRRCDMPAGHTGYHTDGDISWIGRERWRFAGREYTLDGVPYYVWQLLNLDGTVNSSVARPVNQLLAGWDFRYGVQL